MPTWSTRGQCEAPPISVNLLVLDICSTLLDQVTDLNKRGVRPATACSWCVPKRCSSAPLSTPKVQSMKLPVVFILFFLSVPKRTGNSNNRFCCCYLALAFPLGTFFFFLLVLPCDLNGPFPDRCRQTPGGRSWYRPAGVCRHVRHRVCLSAGLWGPLCQQANIVRRLPKKAEKRGIIMIKIKTGPEKMIISQPAETN